MSRDLGYSNFPISPLLSLKINNSHSAYFGHAFMKLYRSFATVGGMTMLSRILGFAREILIAFFFGAGWVADAFFVAFRFPNLFRRIFAEGAFNAAFIPLFSKKLEGEGKSGAKRFAEDAMALLLTMLLILLAIAELTMPWIAYAIAPGFSRNPEKLQLVIILSQIMFPYLLFVSIAAFLSGILNALGRFALAAAAPVILNVILVGILLYAVYAGLTDTKSVILYMSWGVFITGVLHMLMLVYAVQKENLILEFRRPRFTSEMRHFLMLAIPGVIVGAVTQINILIGQSIVSFQNGAVSVLNFADRIYQLPLGMIGIAIGVVLLPNISAQLRSGNMKGVHNSQNRSLEFSLLLTIPASVALFVAPEEIVRVLFERGKFSVENTQHTAWALAAFAWGLPSFVLIKVFTPAFFAREDTMTPMIYAVIGIACNTVLSIVLYQFIGFVGIAIATTVAGWVTTGLLWNKLRKMGYFKADRQLIMSLGPILVSSVIMGCLIWFGVQIGSHLFAPGQALLVQVISLGILVCGGFLSYAASAHFTGAIHIPTFLRMLFNRKAA